MNNISNPALGNGLLALTGVAFIGQLLSVVVTLLFVVATVVFIFMLFIGGAQWVSSGGDKAAIEEARGKLVSALIGFILLLAVFAIIKAVETMFGVSLLMIDVESLRLK